MILGYIAILGLTVLILVYLVGIYRKTMSNTNVQQSIDFNRKFCGQIDVEGSNWLICGWHVVFSCFSLLSTLFGGTYHNFCDQILKLQTFSGRVLYGGYNIANLAIIM